MAWQTVLQYLRSVGFRGTMRAADWNIVTPRVRIPINLTNDGTTRILSGTAASSNGSQPNWYGDPNLAAFMPATGRFFTVFDRYQFQLGFSTDAEEQGAIAQIIQGKPGVVGTGAPGLALEHQPPGKRNYVYLAAPGAVHVESVTAASSTVSATTIVGSQTPYIGTSGIVDIGKPVAIDWANDTVRVTYPTVVAAPNTFAGYLDLYGFSIQYDQYPEIEEIVRQSGPGALLEHGEVKHAIPGLLAKRLAASASAVASAATGRKA